MVVCGYGEVRCFFKMLTCCDNLNHLAVKMFIMTRCSAKTYSPGTLSPDSGNQHPYRLKWNHKIVNSVFRVSNTNFT